MNSKGCCSLMVVMIFIAGPVRIGQAQMAVTSGVRVNTFYDDREEQTDGFELTFPIGVTYKGESLFFGLESSYSQLNVTPGDSPKTELSGFTDTSLSFSYTWPLPMVVTLGVNANLPTGRTRLTEEEYAAQSLVESDLVVISEFGEGLNISPNVNLIRQFGKSTVGVNAAYIYTGDYDPTQDVPADAVDPGDQLLLSGMLKWQVRRAVSAGALASYTYTFAKHVNDEEQSQEGGIFTLGATVGYIGAALSASGNLQFIGQQKNWELIDGSLQKEAENSNNSRKIRSFLDLTYAVSPSLLFVAQSGVGYDFTSDRQDDARGLPFSGDTLRYSFGLGTQYLLGRRLSLFLLATYNRLHKEHSVALQQDTISEGVAINCEIVYTR